jgi:hypothetical protein
MAVRQLPLRQRVLNWAGDRVARMIWQAGRLRKEPHRDSVLYARLRNLGGWQLADKRPLIKPTPANLRRFGKTPYARRAIKRIKDPIANLEWEIAPKKNIEWNSELRKQAALATYCLSEPNRDDSFRSFVEQLIEDLCTVGAGCYEHQIGGDKARPWWAWPVDAMSIQINPLWDGSRSDPRYYQTIGFGNIGGVQGVPLLNEELVYARQEPSTENPFGLGQLEVAFAAINRKLGVEDYAGKVASAAQPENMLVFPGATPEELTTFRDWWRNDIEGQGQTPLVGAPVDQGTQGGTAKIDVLKLRGAEDKALFIGYQELLIREIATSFSISPLSLGVQNDVNRNTAEVVDDMDWDNAVVPTATLLAAYITRESVNTRMGFSQLQFRFLGLKRDDKLAEAQIYEKEYKNNAVTPNEYRARNNMAPAEGEWGDLFYVDTEIATMAARGTGEIDDPDLPPPRSSAKANSKEK